MRLLKILARTTFSDYLLIFQIYFLLYLSKWKIETKELKEIIDWASIGKREEEFTPSPDQIRYIRKISHYTKVLSHFVLFKSKCYDQALTVKKMLNKKEVPATLSMGLKIGESERVEMKAHAWVNFKNWIIIGGKIKNNYTELGSFY